MNGPYKIGTLARLTGFSPALLRVWERRFGLIAPARGDGRQRVYGDDDLTVLKRVRVLLDQRRSIGEIAAQGRARLLDQRYTETPADGPASASSGAADLCRRIVDAALALDARVLGSTLDEAFAELGADRTVADVIIPAEARLGDLWESGRCSVASEHLASSRFLHRLGRLLETTQPASESAPRVIAACFPDEYHQIGLLVLAWHLARHGVRVDYLGAAMPLEDLAKACAASRPQALLLSVTRRELFTRQKRNIERQFRAGPVRVYVGGRGVPVSARRGGLVAFVHASPVADAVGRITADLSGRPAASRARQ